MRTYPFSLEEEDSLILVDCHSAGENLVFALDTGASSTVIDLAALIVAGYTVEDAIGKAELETANGCVEALIFVIREFHALGLTRLWKFVLMISLVQMFLLPYMEHWA